MIKNKIIPKLKDLFQDKELMGDICPTGVLTRTNIDDVFSLLRGKNVNEIKVNWREMLFIAMFVLANMGNNESNKWDALKILREGKIDKFLGVKLYVYEE